jgi:hypothetical protein
LYIPQESPDAGLSEPKLVVTHTIKWFVCVMITPPFLFVNTTSRMQQYKSCRHHWTERILILKSLKDCH